MSLLVLSSCLALFAVGRVAVAGSTRALEVVPEINIGRYHHPQASVLRYDGADGQNT